MSAKRIPAGDVVHIRQAALVTASDGDPVGQPLTVIPLVDRDEIVGLEVRCQCGSRAVIDCVFEPDSDAQPEAAEESP